MYNSLLQNSHQPDLIKIWRGLILLLNYIDWSSQDINFTVNIWSNLAFEVLETVIICINNLP